MSEHENLICVEGKRCSNCPFVGNVAVKAVIVDRRDGSLTVDYVDGTEPAPERDQADSANAKDAKMLIRFGVCSSHGSWDTEKYSELNENMMG
ncbi:hypothetical protein KC878_04630 [Candidatus Saccharibacteria bacterium]|nr:hypothetical protein [Candidatus Saccharibacteria bacterium]MCB9821211.1 hypothetical protein [Candidatus Nomurabacteria bacterium]